MSNKLRPYAEYRQWSNNIPMEGRYMKNMTVYDSLLPAFRGVFRADPFEILDRVFEDDFVPGFNSRSPAVDVREKDGRYMIEAELPGVSEKDLKVELKDGLLTLSTTKVEEKKEESVKWLRRERRDFSFTRSFALPEDADGEKIEAHFKDGLLIIELPKKAEAAPRIVQVKVA
jgi:HSP20 family protein